MNQKVAAEFLREMHAVRRQLNDSLFMIRRECPDEEFKFYRRAVGKLMGGLFLEVVTPIYNEHPSLIPPDLHTKNQESAD